MKLASRSALALALVGALPGAAPAQTAPASTAPAPTGAAAAQPNPAALSPSALVHLQPDPSDAVKPYVVDPATSNMGRDELIAALRKKVRYVFVVFNENHSFDNEYGTLPGVNGLYSDGVKPQIGRAHV